MLRRRIAAGVVDIDAQLAVVVEAAEMISRVQTHLELADLRAKREKHEAEQLARRAKEGAR